MGRHKWIIILSILMVFCTATVFADNNDWIKVEMNGEKVDVRQVEILLDGQALQSEVPSFIHIDRTLVPVRFVSERYGAKVDWDQSTKTATVLHENNEIKLIIDSPMASFNGEVKVLDKNSIPRLASFDGEYAYTMVPFAFITEMLGYEDWGYDELSKAPYINSKPLDNKNEEDTEEDDKGSELLSTITNISIDKGSTDKNKVVINSTSKIKYTTEVISKDNKLIVDIENSVLNIKGAGDKPGSISLKDDNFTKLEYSQYSSKPDIVRVVITMTDDLDYDIVSSDDNTRNVISFVNKIEDFRIEDINDKDLILIEGTDNIEYNVMRLSNPERIVIDILDASLSYGTYHEFDYELGFIKGIRVSQFQGDNNYSSLDRIVRVVVDIKEGTSNPLVKIDNMDNNLVIYPEKSLWENMSYEVDGKDRILTIKNISSSKYSIENYSDKKILELRMPSSSTELDEGNIFIKDGLIDDVEVKKDRKETVIQIKYKKSIIFENLSSKNDKDIVLKINRNLDVKPSDRLIVIDPGHGGTDPGAKSVTGKYEKDLNFSVSNILSENLKDMGYNVLLTRDTDTFVDLYERARIANNNNADIFISIHGNSLGGNSSINGLEVYYWPANKSDIKEEDQYPLAKSIFDEMIKSTGAVSRGVKTNSYVVVRETKMPAVLIETGFISNPHEESLLFTEEYQNKMVEGIIKGIENYFEMY